MSEDDRSTRGTGTRVGGRRPMHGLRRPGWRVVWACLVVVGAPLCTLAQVPELVGVGPPFAAFELDESVDAAEPGPGEHPDDSAPPVARDLRLSRFFNRLGRSFLAIGGVENVRPALLLAGAAGAARLLDDPVNESAGGPVRIAEEVGEVGAVVGNAAVLGGTFGGMVLIGHATGHTETYATGQSLLQGLIVTEALVQTMKRAVGRERPDGSNQSSFPSGHTADMVMTATIAGHRLGKKVGIPVSLLAGAVAASRIEKNVHWFSDVVAGAGVGYIVGRSVLRSNGLFVQRRRVTWTPVATPTRMAMVVTW